MDVRLLGLQSDQAAGGDAAVHHQPDVEGEGSAFLQLHLDVQGLGVVLEEDQGLPLERDDLLPVVGGNLQTADPHVGDLDNAVAVVDDVVYYWNGDDNPKKMEILEIFKYC